MLKITRLSNKTTSSRNNSNKLDSCRNNNSRQVFRRNNGNGENDGYGIGENDMKYVKKSGKLFKSEKSKSEKTSKS